VAHILANNGTRIKRGKNQVPQGRGLEKNNPTQFAPDGPHRSRSPACEQLAPSRRYRSGEDALQRATKGDLAAGSPTSAEGDILWTSDVSSRMAWNHMRAAAALVAVALFIIALAKLTLIG